LIHRPDFPPNISPMKHNEIIQIDVGPYSSVPGESWSIKLEVIPLDEHTEITISCDSSEGYVDTKHFESQPSSFRTLLAAYISAPEIYNLPKYADIQCSGLTQWQQDLLPVLCTDPDEPISLFDTAQILSLDDWHLEKFAGSVCTLHLDEVYTLSRFFVDTLEILELEDCDLLQLLDNFNLRGMEDFWPKLLANLKLAVQEKEDADSARLSELEQFASVNHDYFQNTIWSIAAYRHPMGKIIEASKKKSVYHYAKVYLEKHKTLPRGKHIVSYFSFSDTKKMEVTYADREE